MEQKLKNIRIFRYIVAIFICLFGFSVKIILIKTIKYPENGFLISTATIIVSAWYGGLGPGLVAVIVNYLIVDWFFITPQALFFQDSFVDQIRIALFIIEGVFISWLFESLHKSKKKTEDSLIIIAHELRTPVSIMKVIIENMQLQFTKNRHLKKEMPSILDLHGEIDRLNLLLGNSLDILRLRNKKFSLHFREIALLEFLEKVIAKMKLIAGREKSITLEKGKDKKSFAPTIFADPLKIEQVIMNLLDNAIKFTPKKGKIIISTQAAGTMVIVSIFNQTDREIPQDQSLIIFNKFYQLIKKPVKGLGLGLYISKEIIKQHGGEMWVKPEKGKGNTFSFSLPIKSNF